MTSQKQSYTTDEAASLLGMNRTHIAALCRSGRLAARMERPDGSQKRAPGAWQRWIIAAESVHAFTPTRHGLRFFDVYPGRADKRRNPRPYLEAVCHVYDMTPEALVAAGRGPLWVEARRVLAYLLYVDAGQGMCAIAALTRRDHSTTHHAIRSAMETPSEEVTWAIAECRAVIAKRRAERARKAS